jgi:hypothetical protein
VESKHAPEQQTGVVPVQTFAHPPQLATSFCVSRMPAQQAWPAAHCTPHVPQFWQSLARSAQCPWQHAGDWRLHTTPHPPQL